MNFKEILDEFKKIYEDLRPNRTIWWVGFYLALLFSFLFLLPGAGYVMMQFRFVKERKIPDYPGLISQIDDWIPLGILLLCQFLFFTLSSLAVLMLRLIFNLIHPFFGCLMSMGVFLVICSFTLPAFTYATILICERKINAIDALKRALGMIVVDLKKEFILGLCFTVSAIPFGIFAPLGLHMVIKNYCRKVST